MFKKLLLFFVFIVASNAFAIDHRPRWSVCELQMMDSSYLPNLKLREKELVRKIDEISTSQINTYVEEKQEYDLSPNGGNAGFFNWLGQSFGVTKGSYKTRRIQHTRAARPSDYSDVESELRSIRTTISKIESGSAASGEDNTASLEDQLKELNLIKRIEGYLLGMAHANVQSTTVRNESWTMTKVKFRESELLQSIRQTAAKTGANVESRISDINEAGRKYEDYVKYFGNE